MDLYQDYMSSLEDSDMKLESAFIFYTNLGMHFFIHMTKARYHAMNILQGQNPISYADFMAYQKIRDILEKMKERCEMLKGDTDLPYEAAGLYMDVMLEECSIMFKFYLHKPIAVEELTTHVDNRDRVHCDEFNKLFLPEVAPEDRKDVLTFQKDMDKRLEIMYGQILAYNELGLNVHEF